MTKFKLPLAKDLMTRNIKTVSPETKLDELIEFFVKHDITCAAVVPAKDSKRLIGFISEGDALTHLSNEVFSVPFGEPMTVDMMMKRHPVAVTTDIDIFSVASIFISHRFHQLPVVDDDYNLLGLISRHHVLKTLYGFDRKALQEYILDHYPPDVRQVSNLRFVSSLL